MLRYRKVCKMRGGFSHLLAKITTLHARDGVILWHYHYTREEFDTSQVIGSRPWDWVHSDDKQHVKTAFALAAIGEPEAPARYRLDPTLFSPELIVETLWQRVPGDMVIGISSTWMSVLESLTNRERAVAKLLPSLAIKEIAAKLGVSARTVETIKYRISEKVDLLGPALVAWCQSHADVL